MGSGFSIRVLRCRINGLRPIGWAALAVMVAACLGSHQPANDETQPPLGAIHVPTTCDATRPATAHYAGESAPLNLSLDRPLPCLSKTGKNSREPTIGISAKGTLFLYPAMTGDNTKPSGISISTDHGLSWKTVLPGLAGQPTHVISLDPYFFLDPRTGRLFADDMVSPNCSIFSWSDDEGATWQNSLSGCMETDHVTIFSGKSIQSATVGYPNILYRCAITAGATFGASAAAACQRSLDGGRSWMPPGEPAYTTPPEKLPRACNGALGHGVSDSEGRIYLPRGVCNAEPWLAISSDEGLTWKQVRVSQLGMNPGHETGVGVDDHGAIYYFWIAEDRLPYLTVSRDHAATWSTPLMVGVPGLVQASLPELAVGGEGKVAFVYMGTTNGPAKPFTGDYKATTWNAYLGISYDALSAHPLVFTASINEPNRDPFVLGQCGGATCAGVQDFLDVRIGPDGTPCAGFIDACPGEGAACPPSSEVLDTHREGALGWLVGARSLWGDADQNGPYP
jgi:hypothetical protein